MSEEWIMAIIVIIIFTVWLLWKAFWWAIDSVRVAEIKRRIKHTLHRLRK